MRFIASSLAIGSSVAIAFSCPGVAQGRDHEVYTDLELGWTSQYFYRGIRQADSGFIFQPILELGGPVLARREGGDSGDVEWIMGVRNSLHEGAAGPTGASAGVGASAAPGSMWYEADFYLGGKASLTRALSLQAYYGARHSPAGRFRTVQEVRFRIDLDDVGGLDESSEPRRGGILGFRPYTTLAFETSRGSDLGGSTGVYLELGAEPSYRLTEKVLLTAPLALGFSLNDYYERGNGDDDLFGFFSTGLHASAPMDFVPTRFGPWQLRAGIDLMFLGGNTKTFNGRDAFEVIASLGASVRW